MFAGLLNINWPSLQHAYGPAGDVPEMLLGFVSDDPCEREIALEWFSAAVHHQGDVYDSTVACLPFLFELITDSSIADRGPVAQLLVSIGTSARARVQGGSDTSANCAPYAQAHLIIQDRAEDFAPLLADPDVEVRSAAAAALALFSADTEHVLALLRGRLESEPVIECRITLIRAAADMAARADTASVTDWLGRIALAADDPGTRLAALVHAIRLAPEPWVDDLGAKTVALLQEISEYPSYTAAPPDDRPFTPTLSGMLRELAPKPAARADAWIGDLLCELDNALTGRTADRISLLEHRLHDPDPERRVNALRLSDQLIQSWRGSFEHLIDMIGGQLRAPEREVRHAAAEALSDTYGLAAPAADALAEQVVSAGPESWCHPDEEIRAHYQRMLCAVARLGDARAVPGMVAALYTGRDTGRLVRRLGAYTAHRREFVPAVLEQIAETTRELGGGDGTSLDNLLTAAGCLGVHEALQDVQRILDAAIRAEHYPMMYKALYPLKCFGQAAAAALPMVIELMWSPNPSVALRAAETAWSITGDSDLVVPVVRSWFGTEEADQAAVVAGKMGEQGTPLVESLLPLLTSDERWNRITAGEALVRITGEAELALPVFAAEWQEHTHGRDTIAECVGMLGAAAESFLPLLRDELAEPQRLIARAGFAMSGFLERDEKLVTLCTSAIARITAQV
ncbi:hypothetical protein VMT65_22975 [Nocardia sp. CDC153]|uniref:hypothetical protein n=1 Tax=Nocardia sp. CDC153 TaxID=3112167 RepID=UPI002DBD1D76|nr:hypothetical protein [Nocardia sp. CDC153]MEC3955916.1 hypothetical protein [Nocardia sp. CDC153]